MFVVTTGEVELVLDGGGRRKRLSKGAFFGELALLFPGQGRSGGARALPGTELLEITREGFARLRASVPELAVEIVCRSVRALLSSERALIAHLQARNAELERTLDFLRRTQEELSAAELAAHTDALTGLYNRRCLEKYAPHYICRAEESGSGLALLLVDLDHFKEINDACGHPAGDAALREVAARVKATVRWSDLPCRLGGDEFAVLLTDIPSPAVGRGRAEALQRAVREVEVETEGRKLPVACSVGGTLHRPGDTLTTLLRRADVAVYAAKQGGRGLVVWDDEALALGGGEQG